MTTAVAAPVRSIIERGEVRIEVLAQGAGPRIALLPRQAAQRVAGDRTSREEDYAGGCARSLCLQPDHDPLAHVEDAHEFKRVLGERVTTVVIRNARHAAVAEQPEAISRALIDFASILWPR